MEKINPIKIFIPHWSYIIPNEIFEKYDCIVFHMTDLPFGRGGSPLQNLIIAGHKQTKISAIKVVKELDAGPIYLKENLDLVGSAEEIFLRGTSIVENIIIEIINKQLKPKEQKGEITHFKRRNPKQSNIFHLKKIDEIYDYIRMLDAENYPKAFIENDLFRFEFTKANFKSKKEIIANVRIIKK